MKVSTKGLRDLRTKDLVPGMILSPYWDDNTWVRRKSDLVEILNSAIIKHSFDGPHHFPGRVGSVVLLVRGRFQPTLMGKREGRARYKYHVYVVAPQHPYPAVDLVKPSARHPAFYGPFFCLSRNYVSTAEVGNLKDEKFGFNKAFRLYRQYVVKYRAVEV